MLPYTGDRVLTTLRRGYAAAAQPGTPNAPLEPPSTEYDNGVFPQDTLPAPYWNFFISNLVNNSERAREWIAIVAANLDQIMRAANTAPNWGYTGASTDLLNSIRRIIGNVGSNISDALQAEIQRATQVEAQLAENISLVNQAAVNRDQDRQNDIAAIQLITDDLWTALQNESARAQTAEQNIRDWIDTKVQVRNINMFGSGTMIISLFDLGLDPSSNWVFFAYPRTDYGLLRSINVTRQDNDVRIAVFTDTYPYTSPQLGAPTQGRPKVFGDPANLFGSFMWGEFTGGQSFSIELVCIRL